MKISFIGSGNLAWHLAQKLEKSDHQILEVYSRTLPNALALCEKLYQARAITHLNLSDSKAGLFIFSLSDDILPQIIEQIDLPENCMAVHTSGSQPLNVFSGLKNKKIKTGVFYPLQTFSKNKKVNISNIPFCIEASDRETHKVLSEVAASLSQKVFSIDSRQRKQLHIAAVFACNFVNFLWWAAQDILNKEKLPFHLLYPLIEETYKKMMETGPEAAQTGPARRKDLKMISQHLDELSKQPDYQKIYHLLSRLILEKYK